MEIFKPGVYFDFWKQRVIWIPLSAILALVSLALVIYPGLNFGTDFRGGTEIEVAFLKAVSPTELREKVEKLGFGAPDIIRIQDDRSPARFMIRVQEVTAIDDNQRTALANALCFTDPSGGEPSAERCPPEVKATEMKFSPGGDRITLRYDRAPDLQRIRQQAASVAGVELRLAENNPQLVSARDNKVEVQLKSKGDQLIDGLRTSIGADVVPAAPLRVEWVGPKAGKQLRDAAVKSVAIATIFIMAYIAFRFDMRFAPGAIIAMLHDVFIVMGIFVVLKKEFSLSTVAAVLTIVGYSVNDTVVIYDRIRENLGKHRGKTFPQLINISVSETMSRTILTSLTTLISLAAFLVMGTGAIKDFAFALFIGIIVGTYSSIYIASPVTEFIDRKFFAPKAKTGARPVSRKSAGAVV